MKGFKHLLVAVAAVCLLSAVCWANSMMGTASNAKLGDEDVSVKQAQAQTKQAAEANKRSEGRAKLPNGRAYVGVHGALNCRTSVWGTIQTTFANNQPVNIVGRNGDWYIIDSPRKGYVHARYIFPSPNMRYYGDDPEIPSSAPGGGNVVLDVKGGSVQARVLSAAKNLVNKYSTSGSFPYAAATNGGRLGCAQVVTTALKAAGVLSSTSLGCLSTISMLRNVGWQKVSVPPYKAGDVLFWSTYDSNGDGRNDPNTHVGIVMNSGNNVQVMNNSSSLRKPRYTSVHMAPVTTVMRKV